MAINMKIVPALVAWLSQTASQHAPALLAKLTVLGAISDELVADASLLHLADQMDGVSELCVERGSFSAAVQTKIVAFGALIPTAGGLLGIGCNTQQASHVVDSSASITAEHFLCVFEFLVQTDHAGLFSDVLQYHVS